MDQYEDKQLLIDALKNVPQETIADLLHELQDSKTGWSAIQFTNTKADKQQEHNDTMDNEDLRKKWDKARKENTKGNKFLELMDTYVESYLKGEYGGRESHTKIDMENLVSNHSKWHRMMNHRGQGRQYRDDMRRVCFVFHLSFPQANELLWSAGHFFDTDDFRDFILMDCLQKQEYSYEQVDFLLEKYNLAPLFPIPEGKDEPSPLRQHNK